MALEHIAMEFLSISLAFGADDWFLKYRKTRAISYYNIVIHRMWAVLQSDWLNYSPYISSYTASSEKQDGGPKTTRVLQSRKKENIRFEKDNSTRKNSQKNLTG
jgi:hypothetical protein